MIWYVALGSAIGGVARYLLGGIVQAQFGAGFPVGTLTVNASGSLLLGFLLTFALATPAISPEARGFLTLGLCGGYTTFSTFSWETAVLLGGGSYGRAALYITGSVVFSVGGTLLGSAFAREVLSLRQRW